MLSKYLVTRFVKNPTEVKDKKVRASYGLLGGAVGVIVNFLLFLIKLFVGIFSNSIAVTADAFNNLSDAASSVITLISFKLANKPADKEHPFGHGRIEYISALIVSFIVMLVGFEFIKTSFDRVLHPTKINFQLLPFLLILASIGMKLWLGGFNKFLGKSIQSSTLNASSFDAYSDVVASSSVALSLLLSNWIAFPLDGYLGILVSCVILYAGYSLIKETLNPLLGEAPNLELVEEIQNSLVKYPHIDGVHDLVVHDYGPGRRMASIHAEVPCNISIVKIHEIIDKAEKEISKELDLHLVIHMDPINTDSEEVLMAKEELEKVLGNFPSVKSFHDFRIVGEGEVKNLIFDIVIDHTMVSQGEEETLLEKNIDAALKEVHPQYNAFITVDRDYLHVE